MQARFVDEYLVDLNATQAARRAGYSSKSAERIGCELLQKTQVAAAVATRIASRSRRVELKSDRVIEELRALALSDIGEVLDFGDEVPRLRLAKDIPESARRAIQSVKVRRYIENSGSEAREVEVTEFKLYDKGAALDRALRHLGLLSEAKANTHRTVEFKFVHEGRRFGDVARQIGTREDT